MALIACKECKSEVSDGAYVCPKCGVKLRMSLIGKALLMLMGAVLFVISVAAINTLTKPQYVRDADIKKIICNDLKMVPKSECERIHREEIETGKYENREIVSAPSFDKEKSDWEEKNKKDEEDYRELCLNNYKSIRDDYNKAMSKKEWYGAELKVRRCHELTLDERYKRMLLEARSHQ